MLDKGYVRLTRTKYTKVFVVEDRNHWALCAADCDKETDLVLCVDFGLKRELSLNGYTVEFIDHLANAERLEQLNIEMHNFMNTWYLDEKGEDLLEYKGYHLGDTLLLFLVNDISYFCHYFFNIIGLNAIEHEQLFVATSDKTILDCLNKAGLQFVHHPGVVATKKPIYLFPIIKWVNEKTSPSLRFRIKNIAANFFDVCFRVTDSFGKRKPAVFIQNYYPTMPLIEELEKDSSLQIILPNYPGLKGILKYRRVHYSKGMVPEKTAQQMIERFRTKRAAKWNVSGYAVGDFLQGAIGSVLEKHLHDALNKAENTERWMKSVNLRLMIPITNLWVPNRLMMQYCFKNQVPVFMIINGQLNTSYYQDAKDSDYVNSYSVSMKESYFGNKPNVYALGDPRMDKYAGLKPKPISRNAPTIIIGAAGYDSIDLNSYLAYEFDFLYDILQCCEGLKQEGRKAKIILKVRGNGYVHLYEDFVREYFPELNVDIVQDRSFYDLISEGDLYISIFSQTIFEASCFGIPAIYYKKDTQFIHAPFDGKSELVTAVDVAGLKEKIEAFYNGDDHFRQFMSKPVLERYIGWLDGGNTNRNIAFIRELLQKNTNDSSTN
jgi:hypothetical protein